MPETNQLVFSFKEIVTALLKAHDIHEGKWGLFVNFGLSAQNVGPNENELRPAAMVPILQLGIMKFDKDTNLSVDAAQVNPKPITTKHRKSAPN